MAERLVLEASVVDKFSQPLKDLKDKLKNIPRPKAVEGLRQDFEKLRTAISGTGKTVADEFSKSLTGIGLASFTAAGAMAAMAKSVKNFSGNAERIDSLSRATHLSRETIQQFTATASAFGIGADAMAGDLSRVSEEFRLIKAGRAIPSTS